MPENDQYDQLRALREITKDDPKPKKGEHQEKIERALQEHAQDKPHLVILYRVYQAIHEHVLDVHDPEHSEKFDAALAKGREATREVMAEWRVDYTGSTGVQITRHHAIDDMEVVIVDIEDGWFRVKGPRLGGPWVRVADLGDEECFERVAWKLADLGIMPEPDSPRPTPLAEPVEPNPEDSPHEPLLQSLFE